MSSPAGARASNADADAYISACGTYRWTLHRKWDDRPDVLWIMLNPSTADARADDPTIRRCLGFTKAWGYGGLAVANLFAARTTRPAGLRDFPDPVGPENDDVLRALAEQSALVVAAWGAHPLAPSRASHVLPLLSNPRCLGTTRDGHPRHPLYVRSGTQLSPYRQP